MKPLVIDSTLTGLGGIFYPTGQVFALFPDEDCVRQAAAALQAAGHQGDTAYASPDVIVQEIVRTLGNANAPTPAVGAEADTMRRIADLAGNHHHGLLISMTGTDTTDALVQAIAPEGAVAALYYRAFTIEDLISQAAQHGVPSAWEGAKTVEA